MKEILLLAFGGALGTVSRYKLSSIASSSFPTWKFPIGTFIVNLTGCLILGLLLGYVERTNHLLTVDQRLFFITGIIGGFTTFSAFGLETATLLRRSEYLLASTYGCSSLIIGYGLLWAGYTCLATGKTL
ncbi:fluoride efflux transporter CrcB [Methylophilus sp.]|uniref:fluoride efflux transporter CrcB n=1 Tax=Methylophilus sp. TaxID=29541 RepID=UPI004037A5A9